MTIKHFVLVDSTGNFVVSKDRDALMEILSEELDEVSPPLRVFEIILEVQFSDVSLSAVVPADTVSGTLKVNVI
jgi:hypothetical protein